MSNEGYIRIDRKEIPVDAEGNTLVDLFVFLPTSNRYVRFIVKGEPVEEDRTVLLETHAVRDLFASTTALENLKGQDSDNLQQVTTSPPPLSAEMDPSGANYTNVGINSDGETGLGDEAKTQTGDISITQEATAKSEFKIIKGERSESGLIPELALNQNSLPPEMRGEVIGKVAQAEAKKVFKDLLEASQADSVKILTELEKRADDIMAVVAPETKDLKKHLVGNLKYLGLMSDASAITAVAILIALAQGYDSKKSFRDLTLACLIMDSSMSEFTEEQIKQYYLDPDVLPPDVLAKIRKHPAKSYELAESKLKSISDGSMQLILNHHELFNGKGFPRGVRSEALFPMVKVLAFAVDIFENLKRAELRGQKSKLSMVLVNFLEPNAEPHMRRHNRRLVDSILRYLELNPQVVAAMDKDNEA